LVSVRRPDYRCNGCASRKLEIKLLNLFGIWLSADYFRAPGPIASACFLGDRTRQSGENGAASGTIGLGLMTVAQSASSQNPTISTSAPI
jgi:hypothetical protein